MRFVIVLGFVICASAAYLLRQTPLFYTATVVACANVIVSAVVVIVTRKEVAPNRALTALRHVTTALGGFFLFVWFAMP